MTRAVPVASAGHAGGRVPVWRLLTNLPGHIWAHRDLVWQMTMREIGQRYRGSFLGIIWSFVVPLLMLIIYTFVFSVIFRSRWNAADTGESLTTFALTLFAGLAAFNLFSEVVTRSPTLVLGAPNLVKKVVFPLDLLPVILLASATINSLISVLLIVTSHFVLNGIVSATLWLLPLLYLPLWLLCLGISWFLSSLGVYVRDIGQAISVVVQVMFFLSPIFYPVENVPEPFRGWMSFNPLTSILSDFRRVLLLGAMPDWGAWAVLTAAALCLALLGYVWFHRTKRGFADVM